tara:strand:- start:306 stop:659 length:354 start_codon:yes stop_codon:yes gene_type:complete
MLLMVVIHILLIQAHFVQKVDRQANMVQRHHCRGRGVHIRERPSQVVELVEMVFQQHHLLLEELVVAAVLAVMVVMADQVVALDPDPMLLPLHLVVAEVGPVAALETMLVAAVELDC